MCEKDFLYKASIIEQFKLYLIVNNNLAYWSYSNRLLNKKDTLLAIEQGYNIDINKQSKLREQYQYKLLRKDLV